GIDALDPRRAGRPAVAGDAVRPHWAARARHDDQALAPVRPRFAWGVTFLNEGALNRLELPAIRSLVAERTAFAPGRELAGALLPTTDRRRCRRDRERDRCDRRGARPGQRSARLASRQPPRGPGATSAASRRPGSLSGSAAGPAGSDRDAARRALRRAGEGRAPGRG